MSQLLGRALTDEEKSQAGAPLLQPEPAAGKGKKAKVQEEEEVERFGMVIWTDGGARPILNYRNPGAAGWGMHGYYFNAVSPKKGTGNADYVVTSFGYVAKPEYNKEQGATITDKHWEAMRKGDNTPKEITPIHYVDGWGCFPAPQTNNYAELMGAIRALEHALEFRVDLLRMHIDSEYVRKGITEWYRGWVRNGWITAKGEPVRNQAEWELLNEVVQRLKDRGTHIQWHWVKGHGTDYGNIISDKYATVACFKAMDRILGRTGDSGLQDISIHDPQGYWKSEVEKHPFISHRRIYFNTIEETNRSGEYYIGVHDKDEELLGQRTIKGAYAVVKLHEPDPAIETLRQRHIELAEGGNTIIIGRLDQLFSPETWADVMTFGGHAMERYKNDLSLRSLTKRPISTEATPARLAHRVALAVEDLITWRDAYLAKHESITVNDLTPILYEKQVKTGKKSKDAPAEVQEILTLKTEYNTGFAKLEVKAAYRCTEGDGVTPVILILGMDLPDRNTLKRLEGYHPKVSLITWCDTDSMMRYATIIETDKDIGIWASYYSNARVLSK